MKRQKLFLTTLLAGLLMSGNVWGAGGYTLTKVTDLTSISNQKYYAIYVKSYQTPKDQTDLSGSNAGYLYYDTSNYGRFRTVSSCSTVQCFWTLDPTSQTTVTSDEGAFACIDVVNQKSLTSFKRDADSNESAFGGMNKNTNVRYVFTATSTGSGEFKMYGDLTGTVNGNSGVACYLNYYKTSNELWIATNSDRAMTVEIYEITLPFEYASNVNSITTWYQLKLRGKHVSYADNKYIVSGTFNPNVPTAADMFAFVGNPKDGFKIVNKAVGTSKAFGSTEVTTNTLVVPTDYADAKTYYLEAYTLNDEPCYQFRESNTTNGFLNDIASSTAVGYWVAAAKGDAGNQWLFEPVTYYAVTAPESGKAYYLANAIYNTGTLRFYTYASDGMCWSNTLSGSSSYIAHKCGDGVKVNDKGDAYYMMTADGKFLTWKGSGDGVNSNKGFVDKYNTTASEKSDWTHLAFLPTVKGDKMDDGYDAHWANSVSVYGRRSASGSYLFSNIVTKKDGTFDRADANFFYRDATNGYSTIFFLIEATDVDVVPVEFSAKDWETAIDLPTNVSATYNGVTIYPVCPYFRASSITVDDVTVTCDNSSNYTISKEFKDGTLKITFSKKTYTVVAQDAAGNEVAAGGVRYSGTDYTNGSNISTADGLTKDELSAISLTGYKSTITIDNATITVTYTSFDKKVLKFTNMSYPGSSIAEGTNNTLVTKTSAEDDLSQYWYAEFNSEGSYYTLRNLKTGNYMSGKNSVTSAAIATCWTTASEVADNNYTHLYIKAGYQGSNYYAIKSVNTEDFVNDYCCAYANDEAICITCWVANTAAAAWTLSVTSTHDVTITDAGWATYCPNYNAKIVSGNATAYYVNVNGTSLVKSEATCIPSLTGVLLKSTEGEGCTVTFAEVNENCVDTGDGVDNNKMIGTTEATSQTFNETGYKYYILANDPNTGIGFYWQVEGGSSATCEPYKAVLNVPSSTGGGIKGFSLEDDTETGINNVDADVDVNANTIYNLAGQRVNGLQKGINIVNGKKVLY